MRLAEDIHAVTEMKRNAATLVRHVSKTRRPMLITQHGQARAMLLDVASYEELKASLLMLRIVAPGEADIRAGPHTASPRNIPADRAGPQEPKA
jgi:prevent-host-death family protein